MPGKTRPIATGCTSNTLALSYSVSTLIESVASAKEEKTEVISSEDMLSNTKVSNRMIREKRKEQKRMMIRKMRCKNHDPTNEHKETRNNPTEDKNDEDVTYKEDEASDRRIPEEIMEEIVGKIVGDEQIGRLGGGVPGPIGLSPGPHLTGAQC